MSIGYKNKCDKEVKITVHLIKSRAAALGIKLKDLCAEVNKRGERIASSNFSAAINGKLDRPQANRVRELAKKILDEREKRK